MGTVNVNRELSSTIILKGIIPNQTFDSIYQVNVFDLKSTVKDKTGSSSNLTDLNLIKIKLLIADSIDLTFADLSETTLLIGNETLVGLATDTSKKSLNFVLPDRITNVNYKDIYNLNKPLEIRYKGKAINLIDTLYIKAVYTFRIKGKI
jgi:hypothetical protein